MRKLMTIILCLLSTHVLSLQEIDLDVSNEDIQITPQDRKLWADDSIAADPRYRASYLNLNQHSNIKQRHSNKYRNKVLGARFISLGSANIPDKTIDQIKIEYGFPLMLEYNQPIISFLDIGAFIHIGHNNYRPAQGSSGKLQINEDYKHMGLSFTFHGLEIDRLRPYIRYSMSKEKYEAQFEQGNSIQEIGNKDEQVDSVSLGAELAIGKRISLSPKITYQNIMGESDKQFAIRGDVWIIPQVSAYLSLDYSNEQQHWVSLVGTRLDF